MEKKSCHFSLLVIFSDNLGFPKFKKNQENTNLMAFELLQNITHQMQQSWTFLNNAFNDKISGSNCKMPFSRKNF